MSTKTKITAAYENFIEEATKFENGNKSAGARARKATLELTKLGKQYRQESIAAGK